MTKSKFNRNKEVSKLQTILNRNSYPRLEMFLLVSLTGTVGFLASYLLLDFDMTTMWIRYLISIAVAYITFILLLRIWLFWKTSNSASNKDNTTSDVASDLGGILDPTLLPNIHYTTSNKFQGAGGTFDGGGASSNYTTDIPDSSYSFSSSSSNIGDIGEVLGSADEGAIPIIVIGALVVVFFSIIFVVFSVVSSAPILFSELLVDGMLSASLYKRLKGIDRYHWLESAIKRTIWPFIFTVVIFVTVGLVIGYYMPGVHSLGEILSLLFA